MLRSTSAVKSFSYCTLFASRRDVPSAGRFGWHWGRRRVIWECCLVSCSAGGALASAWLRQTRPCLGSSSSVRTRLQRRSSRSVLMRHSRSVSGRVPLGECGLSQALLANFHTRALRSSHLILSRLVSHALPHAISCRRARPRCASTWRAAARRRTFAKRCSCPRTRWQPMCGVSTPSSTFIPSRSLSTW